MITDIEKALELIEESTIEASFGDYYVLDCLNVNADGEGPVVIWNSASSDQVVEKVADSFGEFFRQEMKVLYRSMKKNKGNKIYSPMGKSIGLYMVGVI